MPDPIRPKTEREQQPENLLRSALSALCYLENDRPWHGLDISLIDMLEAAASLGIELED